MSALELKILWSLTCFTHYFWVQILSRNPKQAAKGTLQLLLHLEAIGTLKFFKVLGSSSSVLQMRTLCFRGLRIGYSTSSTSLPEELPKTLAPKEIFQGFLVLYHRDRDLRSFHYPLFACWSCSQAKFLGVHPLQEPSPGVPCNLRNVRLCSASWLGGR